MAGRHQRRKIVYQKKSQNRASMILAIVVMAVILIVVVVRGVSLRQKLNEYDQRKEQLQEEIASEEKRSEELDRYSKYTQTDEYVEEVARDKLGLVKKGETVFRRSDGSSSGSTVSAGAEDQTAGDTAASTETESQSNDAQGTESDLQSQTTDQENTSGEGTVLNQNGAAQ